ncbi:hypothetical protein [Roseicella aerolata]|uniref:Uncharacterized protein n=1 Tax=Roseicella aerolata TaxID=2883479 RepID=A0A9X1LCX1_9PROT|nr:hypothetical protein [Roseicella aerolata]MCB4824635.1 hypothetical protein [Roseicella aerolata]
MSRIPLAAAALLLGLAAAPASAQAPAPEDSAAARTMQQNQRAFIPSPARPQVAQERAVKERPVVTAPQAIPGRRFALANEGR